MNEYTEGFINTKNTWKDIFDYIKKYIDSDATFIISEILKDDSAVQINFFYKNKKINLFHCISDDIINGITNKLFKIHSALIIEYNELSIELMKDIISCFGGYIIENNLKNPLARQIRKTNKNKLTIDNSKRKLIEALIESSDKNFSSQCATEIIKNYSKIKEILDIAE